MGVWQASSIGQRYRLHENQPVIVVFWQALNSHREREEKEKMGGWDRVVPYSLGK
jgi:hypothetical protein